jgi:hypothetical protein
LKLVIIRGLGSDLRGTFFVPVSSQDIDFQRLMSWCFVCAQWSWVQLRWEMIVCFVNILPWHLLGHAIKSVTCFDLQFSCSTRPMTSFCIFLAYINTEGIIFNVNMITEHTQNTMTLNVENQCPGLRQAQKMCRVNQIPTP